MCSSGVVKQNKLYFTFIWRREGRKEMFYLTTHSTHFIYGYMVSDIWLRTILIVRKETRCRHIGYSFRLTARVLLYALSHKQNSTYHGLCYTSRGALAETRNSSMGSPHEGSVRRPISPWANALTTELHLALIWRRTTKIACEENPLPPLHGLLFPISSKGSFICTIPQTRQYIPRPLLHQSWSTGWIEILIPS